ncbi:hypothetical protein EV122DRAFT_256426 [Schizophyllum commune]
MRSHAVLIVIRVPVGWAAYELPSRALPVRKLTTCMRGSGRRQFPSHLDGLAHRVVLRAARGAGSQVAQARARPLVLADDSAARAGSSGMVPTLRRVPPIVTRVAATVALAAVRGVRVRGPSKAPDAYVRGRGTGYMRTARIRVPGCGATSLAQKRIAGARRRVNPSSTVARDEKEGGSDGCSYALATTALAGLAERVAVSRAFSGCRIAHIR